jgi:hypothetical protein
MPALSKPIRLRPRRQKDALRLYVLANLAGGAKSDAMASIHARPANGIAKLHRVITLNHGKGKCPLDGKLLGYLLSSSGPFSFSSA